VPISAVNSASMSRVDSLRADVSTAIACSALVQRGGVARMRERNG
jgi:hypothetical protein